MPQARPVRRRPPRSIHTFWAAVMTTKPPTKGAEQSSRLSLRPARSTSQPPSTPPAAAPRVTMAWGRGDRRMERGRPGPGPNLALNRTPSGLRRDGVGGGVTPGGRAERLGARPEGPRGVGREEEGPRRVSPRPHPEPGGGGVVEAQGRGRGAPQARDGGGAVAQREAEAERAQRGGEGGEEDPAAEGSAAETGSRVSGAAGAGAAGGARLSPPAHLPPGGPKSGCVSSGFSGVMSAANACGVRSAARTAAGPASAAAPAPHGRAGQWAGRAALGRDGNGQWGRKAGLASPLGAAHQVQADQWGEGPVGGAPGNRPRVGGAGLHGLKDTHPIGVRCEPRGGARRTASS